MQAAIDQLLGRLLDHLLQALGVGVAGYCLQREECLNGQRKEVSHPCTEHVWSLEQSLDVHRPLLKLRHTS